MGPLKLSFTVLAVIAVTANARDRASPRSPPNPAPRAPVGVFQTVLAGGIARSSAQAITYPMDALRTLAQTRKGAKSLSDLGAGVLLSGCLSTSAFAFPMGAIQFTTFGAVKSALQKSFGECAASTGATTAIAMFSSACASVASCAVGIPQEVLKQRLVTNIYPNFRTAVATIARTEGVRGFYTGWVPTVARNLPYVVITFTTFNHWKTKELERQRKEIIGKGGDGGGKLDTATSLKFGVGAAILGTLATQPIDVVKTRMMTQAASSAAPYTSALQCLSSMITTEGPGILFAGLQPRVAYIAPLWAIQFMLNERIIRAFEEANLRIERIRKA